VRRPVVLVAALCTAGLAVVLSGCSKQSLPLSPSTRAATVGNQADPQTEKYLRRVIRTALELSVYNRFGAEVGGFWLMADQIAQLRKLPEYYSPTEAPFVARAIELYLEAQLQEFYFVEE